MFPITLNTTLPESLFLNDPFVVDLFGNAPSDLIDPFVADPFGSAPSDLIDPFGANVPAEVGAGLEVPFLHDGPVGDQKDSVSFPMSFSVADH